MQRFLMTLVLFAGMNIASNPAFAQNAQSCVSFTVSREFESRRDNATYYRVVARNNCRSDLIVRIETAGPRGWTGRDFYLRAGGRDATSMLSRSGSFQMVSWRNWRR